MKNLTLLFLSSFLLFACSKESSPSGGGNSIAGGGIHSTDPADYPTTLVMTKHSVFIKDGKMQGYIPYPIAVEGDGTGVHYDLYDLQDLDFGISAEGDYLFVGGTQIDSFDGNNSPFGQEFNFSDPSFVGMDRSRFCMEYRVNVYDENITGVTYYTQKSDTTFEKIGYTLSVGGSITKSDGKDCQGNSL